MAFGQRSLKSIGNPTLTSSFGSVMASFHRSFPHLARRPRRFRPVEVSYRVPKLALIDRRRSRHSLDGFALAEHASRASW
jgi:hypothetical protein